MRGRKGGRIQELLREAEAKRVPVLFKKKDEFERFFPGINHQGIALLADQFPYTSIEHILEIWSAEQGYGLIVAADHITDEGNLGALMRTAAFFGAHGLVLPKDRSAGLSVRVRKISSGGYAHLPVARVVNLARTLEILKKQGLWIIGAAEEAHETIYGFDWKRDLVIVVGSEDRGLSRSVRARCDHLVSVPSRGSVNSLNVSVAAGIIFSEIFRQRMD